MEVLNKIIPLILAAIMSVNLSGCGNSTGANGSQPAETSSTQGSKSTDLHAEQAPLEYPKPQPIPESGWTYETLSNLFWVNGNYISLPCSFNDLGDGFDISTDSYFRDYGNNFYAVALMYNEKEIGSVQIHSDDNNYLNGNVEGIMIYYTESHSDSEYPIAINGITIGTETGVAEKYIGKSQSDKRYSYNKKFIYNEKEYTLSVAQMSMEDSTIGHISITL